jgi:hypothetical protein
LTFDLISARVTSIACMLPANFARRTSAAVNGE